MIAVYRVQHQIEAVLDYQHYLAVKKANKGAKKG